MAERLVTVARFENEPQAALCRILLEREGIEAYLSEVNAIAAHWGLSNALGGVKVRVAEKDVTKALGVLSRNREEFEASRAPAGGRVGRDRNPASGSRPPPPGDGVAAPFPRRRCNDNPGDFLSGCCRDRSSCRVPGVVRIILVRE